MNFKMWYQAINIIPRVGKKTWLKLDIISKWLISTRAAVLIMTFLSAAIGGILAYIDGSFKVFPWLVCALGLIFAHATNNMLNDLVDHLKGVDKGNYYRAQYGPQPLEHGLMSIKELLVYIFITGLFALSAGIYLIFLYGLPVFWLTAAGAFFLLFYTWPLKYFGLGELAVIIVWGPLMIGGSYLCASGAWSNRACIISLPYALGVTTVLFGKHIDKLAQDKKKNVRTLPVILGEKVSRYTVILLMFLQYAIAFYYAAFSNFLPLIVTAVPIGLFYSTTQIFLKEKPKTEPKGYPKETWPLYFVAYAFVHNKRFGLFFLLGLIIQAVVVKLIAG